MAVFYPDSVFDTVFTTSVAKDLEDNLQVVAIPNEYLVTITWADGYGQATVCKWMLKSDGVTPADWLGSSYEGKTLQEPINLVICDSIAQNMTDAVTRLESSLAKVGYDKRAGHSAGYKGYISGITFSQLPVESLTAYSDALFIYDNNHGRVFGPYFNGKMWIFFAAFSRESGTVHNYISFNQARDDLATKLVGTGNFITGNRLNLGNAINCVDCDKTTGDHDGFATYLWAIK